MYTRIKRQARDFRVPCPRKLAKLGGVVSYGYIHPRTSIQSVNVPVKIDRRQRQEETSALLKSGDYAHSCDMRRITSAVSSRKKCETGWCGAL